MARFTIDFSDLMDHQIEELAHDLRVKTKADVLRKALGLLYFVVGEQKEGGRLIVENPHENLRKELVTI
jgi:hypothetical protein